MEDINSALGISDTQDDSTSTDVSVSSRRMLNREAYCNKMLRGFKAFPNADAMYFPFSIYNFDKYLEDNNKVSDKDFLYNFERDFGALANRSSMIKQERYLKTIRTIVVVFFVLSMLAAVILFIVTLFASSHSAYPSY